MGIDLVYVVNSDRKPQPRPSAPGWVVLLATLTGLAVFGWFVVALVGTLLS